MTGAGRALAVLAHGRKSAPNKPLPPRAPRPPDLHPPPAYPRGLFPHARPPLIDRITAHLTHQSDQTQPAPQPIHQPAPLPADQPASTTPETANTATPDTQVHLIAPADIDAEALPRDRTTLDPAALAELETSILLTGLRQPVEVWAFSQPREDGPRYGLISGMRRLTAFARLHKDNAEARIPAFIRQPKDIPDAMAKMIAENEIRADISPWEKGRIVVESVDEEIFPTLDAAVAPIFGSCVRFRAPPELPALRRSMS